MDVYTTEEQQVEAIRKWWKANGNSVLMGIALAIAAVLGWQTWNQSKQQNKETASALYSQLMDASTQVQQSRLDNKSEEMTQQLSTLNHLGEQMKTDYAGSEYAVFSAMLMAREAVFAEDFDKAMAELDWAKQNTTSQAMKLVLVLRLARVYSAAGEYDKGLNLLESVHPGAQGDVFEEVRGDIYYAKGDIDSARSAYERALTISMVNGGGQGRPILKIKYDNLLVAGN